MLLSTISGQKPCYLKELSVFPLSLVASYFCPGRDVHFDRTLRNLTGESVWTVGSVMNIFLMEINALQFIQLYDVNSWTMHTCLF